MLRQAKLTVLGIMRATGTMRLVSGTDWRRQKLLILCYHAISINDEHLWDPGLFMPSSLFEKRLQTLRDGRFNVLPLGEAVDQLRRNVLPAKAVVLTFDDGFANFYHQAYPLLKTYRMPATVYLTTYYCYYNRPIFNLMVRYLLWRANKPGTVVRDPALGWDTPQDLGTPEGVDKAVQLLNKYVEARQASGAYKEELAEILAGHLTLDYDQIRRTGVLNLMTPEQAGEIYAGGISVELHTHRHRTPSNRELFAKEIRDNREKIQAITGESPRHFCYPSGVWHQDMLSVLKENGVLTATTCDPGLTLPDTLSLLLPRFVDTTTQTDAEFEGWISGVSQFLPRKSGRG